MDAEGTAGTGSSRGITFRSARTVQKRIAACGSREGVRDERVSLRATTPRRRIPIRVWSILEPRALKLGFVEGVPPYVYVERIQPSNLSAWKNLRRCGLGELPDLILRQAPAPQSIFRGLVCPNGMAASDVLQVWVDVSSHPSRGREQADLIRKRVLERVIKEKR